MKRRLLALGLTLSLLLSVLPIAASAAKQIYTPIATTNIEKQDYAIRGDVVTSYLQDNGDGTLTRVEYVENYTCDDQLLVETYDSDYQIVSQDSLELELALFGGFYSGSEYNYLVFGQENQDEDNSCEVFRVVKYTKDWERVDSVSVYGANTLVPFNAGSLRMVESDGMLYIRTCHAMYTTVDGLNHQANVTLVVQTSNMELTSSNTSILNVDQSGYVSHSFNQFITVDGDGNIVAADHGDANPRAAVLVRYDPMDADRMGSYQWWQSIANTEALEIAGSYGDNYTYVSLGGLECSETSYLLAGNTATFVNGSVADYTRNIFVTSTLSSQFNQSGTTYHQITNYTSKDDVTVTTPQLVKIDDEQFLLMWTENDTRLCYVFLDQDGETTSKIYTQDGVFQSDCQPIVVDNQVVWYVTDGTAPQFYAINLDKPSKVKTCNQLDSAGYTYYISDDGVMITGASNYLVGAEMVLPDTIEGITVTEIGSGAFANNTILTSVEIPEGVKYIDAFTFSNCTSLTSVTIPTTMTIINYCAFYNCDNLTDVYYAGSPSQWEDIVWSDIAIDTAVTTIHYGAEDPEPEDSTPVETAPGVSEPVGSDSITVQPEGTIPGDTIPVETIPGDTVPVETIPGDTTPADTTPVDTQPTDTVTVNYAQLAADRFADVSLSDWYATYVGRAYNLGVMTGTSDTTFEPLGTTTRSAFVQSLYAMKGKPAVSGVTPFVDLTAAWYQDAVLWAYQNGVTGGTSDTTFGPEEKVTREQIAVFLYAYAGRPAVSGDLSQFPDAWQVDSWAEDAILWAVENGIMSGSSENGAVYLNPLDSASRGETATMMVGFQAYLYD